LWKADNNIESLGEGLKNGRRPNKAGEDGQGDDKFDVLKRGSTEWWTPIPHPRGKGGSERAVWRGIETRS
jgi:hypothetical protein